VKWGGGRGGWGPVALSPIQSGCVLVVAFELVALQLACKIRERARGWGRGEREMQRVDTGEDSLPFAPLISSAEAAN